MHTIEMSQLEMSFLRNSLDHIQIQGKDAKFVAVLQQKLEDKLTELEKAKQDTKPK